MVFVLLEAAASAASASVSGSEALVQIHLGFLGSYGFDLQDIFSVDSMRLFLEAAMIAFIIYVFLKKAPQTGLTHELSRKEQDDLVAEWSPEPIHPEMTAQQELDQHEVTPDGKATAHVTVRGKPVINFGSADFLGLIGNAKIEDASEAALRKYGCGSCGPRGFYGSVDVHLELEDKLATFMRTEAAILYSCGFATVASAIPAFLKQGDLIICDSGVSHAVQTGCLLSRSKVEYFKHNDVADLKRVLERTKNHPPNFRKFVVLESLYFNYGDLCPLPDILALKDQYRFRIAMDESYSFGTLGATGRGLTEHYGLPPSSVEMITASLHGAAGAVGGFCCGDKAIAYHQRLNGSGYIFSASSPPFLSVATAAALDVIDTEPDRLVRLAANARHAHSVLGGIPAATLTSQPESPVLHLRLREPSTDRLADDVRLQRIVDKALEAGVLVTRSKYVAAAEKFLPVPSLRVLISADHTHQDIERLAAVLTPLFSAP